VVRLIHDEKLEAHGPQAMQAFYIWGGLDGGDDDLPAAKGWWAERDCARTPFYDEIDLGSSAF
jgi:hypothetical protein